MSSGFLSSFPLSFVLKSIVSLIELKPEQGSYTSLFAAASPLVRDKLDLYRGSYLVPEGRISPSTEAGNSLDLARKLWETSEGIIKDTYGL